MKLHRFFLIPLACLALAAHGCTESTDQLTQPNILWLTIEDTSPYQFSCYGNRDINTPVIDGLAASGIRYVNAIANAPHCSPARSTLITGSYATTFGMDIHRERYDTPDDIFYPPFLREAGYFCTNNSKTDYNSTIDDCSIWDECGAHATYDSPARKPGQPFFSVFNANATHMGFVRTITTEGRPDLAELGIDPESIFLPPHVPDLPEIRNDEAMMLFASRETDRWVEAFLKDLEAKGLDENTIVFFYSDHGGCLPRGKGFPFESGLRVPLIVYVPPAWQKTLDMNPGKVDPSLVGFVDFAPTLLSLAGAEIPDFMQGRIFLGPEKDEPARYNFGFRSNQENYHYDPCRTVSDGRFKYIRNYIPHKPFCLRNLYQWGMPANQAWDEYVMSGSCSNVEWLQPYQPKTSEMLFDLEADPWELNNLADNPAYQGQLLMLRSEVEDHTRSTRDLGFFPRGIRKKPGGLYGWLENNEFPMEALWSAAELAGRVEVDDTSGLIGLLQSSQPEIRYWGAVGFCTLGSRNELQNAPEALVNALQDEEDLVSCAVAEALCYLSEFETGFEKLFDLFKGNFSPAYSSLETLTWYPEQKYMMKTMLPEFIALNREVGIEEDRMGLGLKIRSLMVNLGGLPVSGLYTRSEREAGIEKNTKGRGFLYPQDIKKAEE